MSTSTKIIWESSPSKWILLSRIAINILLILASIFALFCYLGEPIPYAPEFLYQAQVIFVSLTLPLDITIWLITAASIFNTIWMYFKISFEEYKITETNFDYKTGVFNRDINEIKLFRIVDISVEIPFLLRLIGRGNLIIFSNDPSLDDNGLRASIQTPDGRKGVYIIAIKDPMLVKETIARQVERSRQSSNTRSTEML
jgi:hypothetical protein